MKEFEKLWTPRAKKPRKELTVYSEEDRAAIGKYAAENGVLKSTLSENTHPY